MDSFRRFVVLTMLLGAACGRGPETEGGLDPNISSGGGTETGNPAAGEVILLSFESSELVASQPALLAAQSVPTTPTVTKALAVVRDATFLDTTGCPELTAPTQPTVMNLLEMFEEKGHDGGEHGALQEGCRPSMIITFGALQAGDGAAMTEEGQKMVGLSLAVRLEGVRDWPIEFRASQEWTTTFSQAQEWVDPSAGENLILGFDRDGWFSGIDLNDPSYPLVSEEGEMIYLVGEAAFPEVLSRLVTNKVNSSGLFRDENGNRHLELDEYLNPIPFSP